MAKIRVQVISRRSTDLAIDHIVNTVYFDDFNIDPTSGTDYQNFATSVRDVFRARPGYAVGFLVETKVYDMGDSEPRPVRATAPPLGPTGGLVTDSGPREVALCLSYYSDRNVPRQRGRLFIGPWGAGQQALRPTAAIIAGLVTLAGGLANVGGADVDWQLYSPTTNSYLKISNGWVDDEWDTVRSRGLRATSRSTFTTGE